MPKLLTLQISFFQKKESPSSHTHKKMKLKAQRSKRDKEGTKKQRAGKTKERNNTMAALLKKKQTKGVKGAKVACYQLPSHSSLLDTEIFTIACTNCSCLTPKFLRMTSSALKIVRCQT